MRLTASAQARIPIILDTDIGDSIDDALALAFALHSPELDVRAVTTVMDDVESQTRLAWKKLGIYNRRDIALAMGASEPLLDPTSPVASKEFTVLTAQRRYPRCRPQARADLIIETRDAIARQNHDGRHRPADQHRSGAQDRSAHQEQDRTDRDDGRRLLSSETEYNIKRDRTAAEIVFQSGVPITAVGLDVTSQCKLRERIWTGMRLADDPAGHFLLRLVDLAEEQTREDIPRCTIPWPSPPYSDRTYWRCRPARSTSRFPAPDRRSSSRRPDPRPGSGQGERRGFSGPVRRPRDERIGRAEII